MSERIKTFVLAEMPADQVRAFMQHIRDFDVAHPGCRFEVGVDQPNITLAETVEQLRSIKPPLTFMKIDDKRP